MHIIVLWMDKWNISNIDSEKKTKYCEWQHWSHFRSYGKHRFSLSIRDIYLYTYNNNTGRPISVFPQRVFQSPVRRMQVAGKWIKTVSYFESELNDAYTLEMHNLNWHIWSTSDERSTMYCGDATGQLAIFSTTNATTQCILLGMRSMQI